MSFPSFRGINAQALCQLITSFIYHSEPGDFTFLKKLWSRFRKVAKNPDLEFPGLRSLLANVASKILANLKAA